MALKFDGAALQLLGQPQTPIDIGKLSTPSEQDAFFKKLSSENSSLVTQNSELLEQKANLEKQVEVEAKANEAEKWKSFLWKSIFSVVGVIGIGGTIALCVFFPPLIPVLAEACRDTLRSHLQRRVRDHFIFY